MGGVAGRVLAIDPGYERSAFVLVDTDPFRVLEHEIGANGPLLVGLGILDATYHPESVVIESLQSYGMPAGRELFETAWWSGRFFQVLSDATVWQKVKIHRPTRPAIKTAVCGRTQGVRDANIRRALLDLYGPQGTRRNPGPTYGLRADEWQALALVRWWEVGR
jgi:hypothetical protein